MGSEECRRCRRKEGRRKAGPQSHRTGVKTVGEMGSQADPDRDMDGDLEPSSGKQGLRKTVLSCGQRNKKEEHLGDLGHSQLAG